ncbi:hypothetical protein OAQ96_00310 [Alphaproteobacteria bacterium]|nr:hypothetical protein [Alphaproteobacteria bacterium]
MKILLTLFVFFFASSVVARDVVFKCNTKTYDKNPENYNFDVMENRIFLVTVNSNNNKIFLENISKSQKDKFPFHILVNNENYILGAGDFSSEDFIWNDMITFDKRNNYFSLMSYVNSRYTIHRGNCRVQ